MPLKFSAPGKTFLVGEYLALKGGPAILATTGPRFELLITKGEGRGEGVHPKSPAGLWMRANSFDFVNINVEFIDPYKGAGGFGASSAEFLFVYLWSAFNKNQSFYLDKINLQDMWRSYRRLASESLDGDQPNKTSQNNLSQKRAQQSKIQPSGLDVIAQFLGGVTAATWEGETLTQAKKFDWGFENQSFCLLKTDTKIKTHEHLETLNLEQDDFSDLKPISLKAIEAFENKDAFNLLVALETYYQTLISRGLVHENTQKIIKQLIASGSILGAKGCGALGADVIWVLCEKEKLEPLKSFFQVVGLKFIASEDQLSNGFEYSGSLEIEDLKESAIKKVETPKVNKSLIPEMPL